MILCYSTWSVCPSVTTFSAPMRNKQVEKRHQRVQRYTGFIFKMVIFVKVLCFKRYGVKTSQQAKYTAQANIPQAYLDRVHSLCVS